MKLRHPSFRASAWIVCALEVILSGAIAGLCVYSWITEGKPTTFLYPLEPSKTVKFAVRNAALESCVFLWCISIVLSICIWRIISAVLLVFCVKRGSAGLGQYWILYKILVLMISLFVGISSFNANGAKIASISSFVVDAVTSYFILILYPEIGRMQRAVIAENKAKNKTIRDKGGDDHE